LQSPTKWGFFYAHESLSFAQANNAHKKAKAASQLGFAIG
jgi:hypothetical protein